MYDFYQVKNSLRPRALFQRRPGQGGISTRHESVLKCIVTVLQFNQIAITCSFNKITKIQTLFSPVSFSVDKNQVRRRPISSTAVHVACKQQRPVLLHQHFLFLLLLLRCLLLTRQVSKCPLIATQKMSQPASHRCQ